MTEPVGGEPSRPKIDGELWDAHATWWKETYTEGADVEYEGEILPLVARELAGSSRVLDVGCGEGQVARSIVASGAHDLVVGVDPSSGQLANAWSREGAPIHFLRAAGEELPFADRQFDGVVCCLAIEHAADADAVLAEICRVLRPGGRFLLLINHPMYQGAGSGFIDDQILGEHYWRVGPYLAETVTVEEIDNGIALPFAHRPLSRYVNPLAERDVLLTKMFEPAPLAAFLEGSIDPELEGAIPRLLAMRFEFRPAAVR